MYGGVADGPLTVTGFDGADAGPVPCSLVAETTKVYEQPDKPPMTQL